MAASLVQLVYKGCAELAWGQKDVAEALGISVRTLQRRASSAGFADAADYQKLVQPLHARNPALAGEIAAALGRSLAELGVHVPPRPAPAAATPPAAAPRAQSPAPPPAKATRAHAEAVICAAADALGVVPREARPIVATIFSRIRDLEIDLTTLTPLLAHPPADATKAVPAKASRAS